MQKKRLFPLLAALLVIAQAITGLFAFPATASAASQDLTALKQYSYYAAFRQCTGVSNNSVTGGKELDTLFPGIWSNTNAWATMGYVVDGDGGNNDGAPDCVAMPKFVTSTFGISADELIKGLGYSLQADGNWSLPTTCNKEDIDGFGNCTKVKYTRPDFKSNWDKLANSKGIPTSEPAGYSWYYLAMAAFTSGCRAVAITTPSDSQKAKATSRTDSYGWVSEVVDTSGKTQQVVYQLQGKSFGDTMHAYPRPNSNVASGDGDASCGDLLSALDGVGNDATTRYANYLKEKSAADTKAAIMDAIDAYCLKTYPNGQPSLQYQDCLSKTYNAQQTCWTQVAEKINNKPTGDYRDRTRDEKVACMKTSGVSGTQSDLIALVNAIDSALGAATIADPIDNEGGTATPEAQCTGGQLGWILCPIMYTFSDFISVAADFLDSMLFINPIGGQSGLQDAWSSFVGIANLLLVVAFLVVIFSQATSLGLNAYGIKKMLPRIIAAAILINLSYFICTLALDIVNIIGGSVGGMIQSLMPATSTLGGQTIQRGAYWVDWLQVGMMAAIAGGIAAAVGAIAFLVPVLLSMAFGVLSIFLAVAMRHAIVILLVIISPLAFAAMILPNTEPLFAKWRKMFTNMLFMYPVAMFLLYGAQLVGALVLLSKNITTSSGAGQNPVSSLIIDVVVALIIVLVPTYGLWKYVSNADKILAMATGAVGKIGASARKASQGWAKEKYNNSTYARTRAWGKAAKEQARIERQGKMEGNSPRAAYNRAMSYAAAASAGDLRNLKSNAGKYRVSASNRAAKEADKIFDEDEGNAAANYAKNGIAGPLMVAHARSGRVVQEYKKADGSIGYKYGRKLTEAEHAAAVKWTMANGKLAERQEVYGSDWASRGRTPEYSRALDAMNDGYFHVNKDVARFGNRFGGTMTSGTVGGDMGVNNAAFVNMASGKTSAEAIIDNDMAQTLANLSALSNDELKQRAQTLVPKELSDQGVTVDQYVAMFRENSKRVADTVMTTKELKAKVKPEFDGAIDEIRGAATPDATRVTGAKEANRKLKEKKDKLKQPAGQDEIVPDEKLTNIQPALDKLEQQAPPTP